MRSEVRIVSWFLCVGTCHLFFLGPLSLTSFSSCLRLLRARFIIVSVVSHISEDITTSPTRKLLRLHILLHLTVLLIIFSTLTWLCLILNSVNLALFSSWFPESTWLLTMTSKISVPFSQTSTSVAFSSAIHSRIPLLAVASIAITSLRRSSLLSEVSRVGRVRTIHVLILNTLRISV